MSLFVPEDEDMALLASFRIFAIRSSEPSWPNGNGGGPRGCSSTDRTKLLVK